MHLSIIIVNYNTCQLTKECLRSVFRSKTRFSYEVIVVDNASIDASVREIKVDFPQVKIIENNSNLGFSKANNLGIDRAEGEYVLLLNSDTVIEADTIETMLQFMISNPQLGAAGCKILLPDGSLDKACKRSFPTPINSTYYALGLAKLFPGNPKFNAYQLGHLSEDDEHFIDCLVGAFMIVRGETIKQVGKLDEDFFMYGEDIDWCYRIKSAGWEIAYNPSATITHYKGASSIKKTCEDCL